MQGAIFGKKEDLTEETQRFYSEREEVYQEVIDAVEKAKKQAISKYTKFSKNWKKGSPLLKAQMLRLDEFKHEIHNDFQKIIEKYGKKIRDDQKHARLNRIVVSEESPKAKPVERKSPKRESPKKEKERREKEP